MNNNDTLISIGNIGLISPTEELNVRRYVNQIFFDQEIFINYLNEHDIIDFAIFEESLKPVAEGGGVHWTFLTAYKPIQRSLFIKRLIIYFFDVNRKENIEISMSDFFDGYYKAINGLAKPDVEMDFMQRAPYTYNKEKDGFEKLYSIIDDFSTTYGINPEQMLTYLYDQSGSVKNYSVFQKWYSYLKLLNDTENANLFPKNIFYAYNVLLEKNGMKPLIYYPAKVRDELDSEKTMAFRVNKNFIIVGMFPVDDEGNPAMQWIAIWTENTLGPRSLVRDLSNDDDGNGNIMLLKEPALRTTLKFGLTSNSKIFIGEREIERNDEFNEVAEIKEYWQQIYAGPKVMELDCNAIVERRIKRNLQPKDVSDETDINLRTYQRIETGEVKPDALNLFKIMNYLNIESYEDIIKKDRIDDEGLEKFKSGKKPSDFIVKSDLVVDDTEI